MLYDDKLAEEQISEEYTNTLPEYGELSALESVDIAESSKPPREEVSEDENEIPISINGEPEQTDNEIVTEKRYYDSPDEEHETIDMSDENEFQENISSIHEILPDEDEYGADENGAIYPEDFG